MGGGCAIATLAEVSTSKLGEDCPPSTLTARANATVGERSAPCSAVEMQAWVKALRGGSMVMTKVMVDVEREEEEEEEAWVLVARVATVVSSGHSASNGELRSPWMSPGCRV